MLTNNDNASSKPKATRRSSLKNRNKSNPLELLKIKKKRNSISWGQTNTFKFKENNPTLEESKNLSNNEAIEKEEKHKKFLETRRRSIQNEFMPSDVLMQKSKEFVEEIINEELKRNMENNIKVGKEASITESSKSDSDSGSKSDKSEESKSSSSNSSKSRSKSKSSDDSGSSKSKSSSKTESDNESENNKKEKEEEKKENNKKPKSRIKFKLDDENQKKKKKKIKKKKKKK